MKTMISIAALIAALTVAPAFALSPAEHAKVAKEYRLRAESFEAKAKKHEAEARKLQARTRSPIEHKWPAMSPQPWVKERQLAMEARRAATESMEIADRHIRASVESLAEVRNGN